MKKLLLAAAMLVVFGGPAVAVHPALTPMIEGVPTQSRTPFCRTVEDARLIGAAYEESGDTAAKILLRMFTVPGAERCGTGRGMVVPLELVGKYTAPDQTVMHLIRVKPGTLKFEIILMTLRPFRQAGKPA